MERVHGNITIHNGLKKRNLRVNLTKDVKDHYNENFTSLEKETKEDIRRYKDLLCSWISTNNRMKMTIPPKESYIFNAIPMEISKKFFTEIYKKKKKILNFLLNHQPTDI